MRCLPWLTLVASGCSTTPQVYGPTFDASADAGDTGTDASGLEDVIAADVLPDVQPDAPGCASKLALVGGSATSLFTAAGPALSPLTASPVTGTLLDCGNDFGCGNPVAIVRGAGGLLAVLASSAGTLLSAAFATSWSAPTAIGTASTIDGPSLAVVGATAHLVFQGPDYKYYHGQFATSWDAANDPVGGTGSSQSYGARAPSAAAAGTDLVIIQAGSNSYLYDQTWNGSWQAASEQGSAAVENMLPPTLVSLSGGTAELLAAYLRNGDYKVMTVTRASGTWASPTLVDANAYSNDPVAVAALPGGKALLVYRGSDKKPYWSMWDGASTWTAPVAVLGASNPTLASAPSVAAGVCGADALVVWAESGAGVTVVPFTAGAFGTPTAIAGTTATKFVAAATLP